MEINLENFVIRFSILSMQIELNWFWITILQETMWTWMNTYMYTIKPVYKGHSREPENMTSINSCPLYTSQNYMHHPLMGQIILSFIDSDLLKRCALYGRFHCVLSDERIWGLLMTILITKWKLKQWRPTIWPVSTKQTHISYIKSQNTNNKKTTTYMPRLKLYNGIPLSW
jgi:hypothetical protein